ncbi:Cyclin-dependent kinase inhibitor 3 [Striga hermonthica]|uniref:Cyclin-dependent kinase inhibitor 3 n=1 Tax=Striga hermonthica TaxID=68872 RepID=A0A9N7RE76_STRHE|nr:Cyclin-dependent kinase inhibitor 3 [Striga hermonthica]
MGKYIRKPKTSGDLSVKDVSQSYLGVRTRAKTLALQRLQSSSASAADASHASPPPPKPDYLELRSRRLEKPPLRKNFPNSPKNPAATEKPQFENSAEKPSPEPAVLPIEPAGEDDGRFERLNGGGSEIGDSEIQASLGENNLDLEARESRGTRESTPCSFIRPGDSISTPGSSTRPRSPSSRAQSARGEIPTARELEEFFAQAEQSHQRRFMEKYNFDIVNDVPLPGRYEWVKVLP